MEDVHTDIGAGLTVAGLTVGDTIVGDTDMVSFPWLTKNPGDLFNWYRRNWNDYQRLGKMSGFPLAGIPARYRRGELEAEETLRYWDDYSKNTGIVLSDNKYPIRSGYFADYSYIGDTFDSAMKAGMSLYRKW